MKIKEKIIHLLGGFTKEDAIIKPVPVYRQARADIRALKVKFATFNSAPTPPAEWIKEDIARKLSKTLVEEGYVRFFNKVIPERDMVEFTGIVKVVAEAEDHEQNKLY